LLKLAGASVDAAVMQISPRSARKLVARTLIVLAAMLLLAPLGIASAVAAAAKPAISITVPNVLKPEEEPAATAAEAGEEEAEGEEEEETEAEEELEELEELEEAEEAEEEYEAEAEAEARAAAGRSHSKGGGAVHISKLALTHSAKSLLEHGHPSASKVSFTFTLSAKSNVRFQLERELHHGVVSSWHPMSSISLTANRGADKGHLYDEGKLSTGEYRLTLTPAGGHASTLQFEVK
jgi:hypothetical protein